MTAIMEKNILSCGFTAMTASDAAVLRGGIDKQAQESMYMIGYVIGVVAKFFASIYTFVKTLFKN